MKITVIAENQFSLSKNIWNALLQNSSNNEFFLTWEWVYTWWQVYGQGKELFIIFINDEWDNVLGIAPLYIKQRSIYFIGVGENVAPEYLNLIIKRGFEEPVIKQLLGYLKQESLRWTITYFNDITEKHMLTDLLITGIKKENLPAYRNYAGTPCVYLPLPKEINAFWEQLSSKFRYNIKWGRKKIQEAPENKIRLFLDEPLPADVIENVFSLHNKRMEEKGGIGKFKSDSYKQFHTKLLERIPNYAAIGLLETNKHPIAMIYCYHYSNKIYFYQSGFDPDSNLKKYSLVQLLLSYMIEKAISLRCSEFDFLRGEEEYKNRWSNLLRKKERIVIFNTANLRGQLFHLKHKAKSLAKTILRK